MEHFILNINVVYAYKYIPDIIPCIKIPISIQEF